MWHHVAPRFHAACLAYFSTLMMEARIGIATGYGPDDQGVGVQVPER
jgi:hypothetical protein